MHLLIPHAASHSEGCQAALATLKLPHLQKLLSRLSPQPLDAGDELSWSPPHERALARSLGLPVTDGQLPWAALEASQRSELAHLPGAWAFVSLCHWQATTHEVTMRQLPMHELSAIESDGLLAAMQPFFAQDGITLHPFEAGRWLAHGAVFDGLPSASPDRVLGRNLSPWMPTASQASGLIRLMSEMQMLFYTHPLNDARERRGALAVNAIWFSGSGTLPDRHPAPASAQPIMAPTLRQAALQDNWAGWASAWQQLDVTHIRQLLDAQRLGDAVQLTLCGERHAQSWVSQPPSLKQKFRQLFSAPPVQGTLEKL
ncbi:phosphoglycerate mutase [Rhodoferax sp.]|uniref:phosphoglycerate mutase n=1 Tax=Rhodoferax sp. TaxID=50421 RepID=UPI0027303387|nr:phosphoglycerate mutase [Rhodoferax sp.]MDP1528114.1 phosphoglycerate mutase [Rhodoferax sp.]MDP1942389.1 phosphoglycerate mutase [Rhodoferax sp.]MDP2440004.1 phosphoglycerate mutase [Rhodoferax sp.]MDZ4209001.1 phosphoglycerate mutase [Rhodoferax sp.]